jgi:trimeric autotransporter adhesin
MKRTAIALFGIMFLLTAGIGSAWGELQTTETFFGLNAGHSYTSGSHYSTFIGNGAGYENTGGSSNVFIGANAGYNNTLGSDNCFLGVYAGSQNTIGENNTFMGSQAALYNSEGSANSFFGYSAGGSNNGSYNTFIGSNAGGHNVTGYNNTYIGQAAGYLATGYGNVFIGNGAGRNELGNNQLRIDNYINSGDSPLIWGDFAAGVVKINGKFYIVSDGRFKKNVEPLQTSLDKVMGLKGVSYEWKEKNGFGKGKDIGFIAQDVEAVLPELVHTDDKGYKSVAYDKLAPVFVEAIKEQQRIIEDQTRTIKTLTDRLARLEKLEAEVNRLKSRDMSAQR